MNMHLREKHGAVTCEETIENTLIICGLMDQLMDKIRGQTYTEPMRNFLRKTPDMWKLSGKTITWTEISVTSY